MRLKFGIYLVAMLSLLVGACSTKATAPQAPPPISTTVTDPTGDTNGGAVGTVYDLTNIATLRTGLPRGAYDTIGVTVTFVQTPVLPAAGAAPDATMVAGFIEFDTDNNFTDGVNHAFCTTGGVYNGIDYFINLFSRLADGNYQIFKQPANTASGEATVAVNGNNVTWTVKIADIGGSATGPFNVAASLGNLTNPTDCAPNAGYDTGAAAFRHPLSVGQRPHW